MSDGDDEPDEPPRKRNASSRKLNQEQKTRSSTPRKRQRISNLIVTAESPRVDDRLHGLDDNVLKEIKAHLDATLVGYVTSLVYFWYMCI